MKEDRPRHYLGASKRPQYRCEQRQCSFQGAGERSRDWTKDYANTLREMERVNVCPAIWE